jgi:hypothetical protein
MTFSQKENYGLVVHSGLLPIDKGTFTAFESLNICSGIRELSLQDSKKIIIRGRRIKQ